MMHYRSSCLLVRAVHGRRVHHSIQYHQLMPISGHLKDCKAFLDTSLTHVSSAVTVTFTFALGGHHEGPSHFLLNFIRLGPVFVQAQSQCCNNDMSSLHVYCCLSYFHWSF